MSRISSFWAFISLSAGISEIRYRQQGYEEYGWAGAIVSAIAMLAFLIHFFFIETDYVTVCDEPCCSGRY